ncbi:predicted protein [Coccidioides posadasii str. Silveira]|uniref:Predicted protein n=1 Tax=Coccidioides posadasii (strain RMSCC 757 / Silveira) TaxID=443226 RepID=E9CTR1_COCPS|nr:predicted protein [Coccidioides posadasii str. Silveira]
MFDGPHKSSKLKRDFSAYPGSLLGLQPSRTLMWYARKAAEVAGACVAKHLMFIIIIIIIHYRLMQPNSGTSDDKGGTCKYHRCLSESSTRSKVYYGLRPCPNLCSSSSLADFSIPRLYPKWKRGILSHMDHDVDGDYINTVNSMRE